MKLRKLIRRMTAALVAGAMALSLCAPALAEGPNETADDTSDSAPQLWVNGNPFDLEDGYGSYDAATHTVKLISLPKVNEGSAIDLYVSADADDSSVNLVLENMTIDTSIFFGGHIDRLEFSGTVERNFENYSDTMGSAVIHGTVNGLVHLETRGDITIDGSVQCDPGRNQNPQLSLNSSEGDVTVNSTGMPFPADQNAVLTAPKGSVTITGNVSGAMVSDALLVNSRSLKVTNNGGAAGSLYFAPAESGTYDFNGTPEDLLAGISDQYSTDGYTLAITPTGTDVLPTLSIYYATDSATNVLIMATPNLVAEANEDLKELCGESALAQLAYDSATHTYSLSFDEGFFLYRLRVSGVASNGVLPSLTFSGNAQTLRFDGEFDTLTVNGNVSDLLSLDDRIDALTINGDISGSIQAYQDYGKDPVLGSFTLNGTFSGRLDVACIGDAYINGALNENDSDNRVNSLYTSAGNIVIDGPAQGPAATHMTNLYAPEGGVWITGSSDDLLMTELPYVYAQKLVMRNNGTGGFPEVWFVPTLNAEYVINGTDPMPELSSSEDGDYEYYAIPASAGSLLTIAPKGADIDLPSDDVDIADTGSGSAGSIGGAIAAAAIGGAAIWGGYEVATRVILHNLLPAGAAIPKTQAELAVLLWTTAGSSEPLNAPAFADVDGTTAKAAQWCTEQGYLTGTFQPDKHVAKYNVIRAWNKAFPKAK